MLISVPLCWFQYRYVDSSTFMLIPVPLCWFQYLYVDSSTVMLIPVSSCWFQYLYVDSSSFMFIALSWHYNLCCVYVCAFVCLYVSLCIGVWWPHPRTSWTPTSLLFCCQIKARLRRERLVLRGEILTQNIMKGVFVLCCVEGDAHKSVCVHEL